MSQFISVDTSEIVKNWDAKKMLADYLKMLPQAVQSASFTVYHKYPFKLFLKSLEGEKFIVFVTGHIYKQVKKGEEFALNS